MAERGLSACILSSPENIFYLTGLDHWGYFAPHMLIVPESGEMVLVARAMERVTVANHVQNARFDGHSDSETPADAAARVLADLTPYPRRIGIETWSAGLPHGLAEALKRNCPRDANGSTRAALVDDIRLVKSPAEQRFMREAARVSDAAATAAIEATHAGASEREIAAACQQAMIVAGGTFPGFGPFIRSTARLGEEHTTWSDTRLAEGDSLFLELSGCVARYHAPLGRLIHVGRAPEDARDIAKVCGDAFDAVLDALKPDALVPRRLCRLAESRRRRRAGALPAAPLRLCRRHRDSAELDRRQQGHGPEARQRTDRQDRHELPRPLLADGHADAAISLFPIRCCSARTARKS